ncbi:MAG: hypothetical protein ACM3X1_02500 [Ignavibacteriales bacterium]
MFFTIYHGRRYHPQSMVGIINVVNSIDNSNMSDSVINMSSTGNPGIFVDDRRGEDRDDDNGDRRGRGGSEDDGNNRGPGSN